MRPALMDEAAWADVRSEALKVLIEAGLATDQQRSNRYFTGRLLVRNIREKPYGNVLPDEVDDVLRPLVEEGLVERIVLSDYQLHGSGDPCKWVAKGYRANFAPEKRQALRNRLGEYGSLADRIPSSSELYFSF